jgi:3-hydroxyacyl-CoA dehydrogenase
LAIFTIGTYPLSNTLQAEYNLHTNPPSIWAAIKRETLLALSEGICEPQEIDAIFKDVLKTPKGPCEQMDIVGLDVVHDIEKHYAEARSGLPSEPREYLQRMIKEGNLGVKSGRGFYDYNSQAQNGH